MPLTQEQDRMLREVHAALAKQRPTVGTALQATRPAQGTPDDPVVPIDPKRGYSGASMIGRRFSECEPQYLGLLSHLLDWLADKNESEGKASYIDSATEQLCAAFRAVHAADKAKRAAKAVK